MRQVPGWGRYDAKYVILAEAPADAEIQLGEPLVGPSGYRLFKEWLPKAGLRREDFRIENVVEFQGTWNQIESFPDEYIKQWMGYVHERLAKLTDPYVIIPMGNYALYSLCGKGKVRWHASDGKTPRAGITEWRGSILSYTDLSGRLIKVVPTIHPAATFRQPDLEGVCIRDWQKIAHEGTFKELNLPKRRHDIRPTLESVESYFESLRPTDVVAVDIENPKPKGDVDEKVPAPIVCIGFSHRPDVSLTVPTTEAYWGSQSVLGQVWKLVGTFLQGSTETVFHNGLYDTFHLRWEHSIEPRCYSFDTLYMHHCLDPSDWHALDYCASRDTREPFWKCLSPETRILKTTLEWTAIKDIKKGDELVGFDESNGKKKRRFRPSLVTHHGFKQAQCRKIYFEDGRVITASVEHPWLTQKYTTSHSLYWVDTKDLAIGMTVGQLGPTWETDKTYEGGWLSGLFDGEGSISRSTLSFCQNPGFVLERGKELLTKKGFKWRLYNKSEVGKVIRIGLTSIPDTLRFLGAFRPVRLLPKHRNTWNGRRIDSLVYKKLKIVAIEDVGEQTVVGIATSTKTFIAEGLYTHNSDWKTYDGICKAGGADESLWEYNGLDACVTRELYNVYHQRLTEQGRLDFYLKHYAALLQPLQALQLHGIRVDNDKRKHRQAHLLADCIEIQDKLEVLTGLKLYGKSSLSNTKLKQYLYEVLALPKQERVRKARGEKSVSADELAVRRLMLKYPAKLKVTGPLLLEHKHKAKLREFYDEGRADFDGRMRASYSMNTEAGRLSSSSNPNGTGSNLQNQSRDIRDMFLADNGMVGVEVDLSAAEARINYIITYMLTGRRDLFEKAQARPDDYDQHKENASFIFNVPTDEVTKDMRQLGKVVVHGCVDKETEILTQDGFKPIPQLTTWDKVAQWDIDTQQITFTLPDQIHIYDHRGEMYRYRTANFSQYITANHRMPYHSNAAYKVKEAHEPRKGCDAPISGFYSGSTDIPHDLVRLIVALQADGSIGRQFSWHFKKLRKVERLIQILNRLQIPFKRLISIDQSVHIRVSLDHGKDLLYWLPDKRFTARLLQLSGDCLNTLIDELPHWDGGFDEQLWCYRSSIYSNALWIQTICHLRGKRTYLRKTEAPKGSFSDKPYWRIAWQDGERVGLPQGRKTNKWHGPVYCVSVPTGFFVMRRNGEVSITGNSWRDMQGQRMSDSLLKEGHFVTPQECDTFIGAYKGRMEGIDDYFRWCRKNVITDRYVENSWGRRLYMTYDRFNDELYRRAYSFYPQAEIGDWMNQLGLVPFWWYIQEVNRREGQVVANINVHAHDALFFSVLPQHAYHVTKFLVDSLEQPRQLYGTTLAIPTEQKCGLNWKGQLEWKRLPAQAQFEEQLRTVVQW